MMTPYEFTEFLKVVRREDKKLFMEFMQGGYDSWRGEYLDFKCEVEGGDMFTNYHIFDKNGNIIEKSEKLDKLTLMGEKVSFISLDSWIDDPTPQGLPKNLIKGGDLYYRGPVKDCVAVFANTSTNAYKGILSLDVDRPYRNDYLGARVARPLK